MASALDEEHNSDEDLGRDHLLWVRASDCVDGDCVEVARIDGGLLLRSSAQVEAEWLWISASEWTVFLAGAKLGDFDSV